MWSMDRLAADIVVYGKICYEICHVVTTDRCTDLQYKMSDNGGLRG